MKKTFDVLYPNIKHILRVVQNFKSQKMSEYGLKGSTAQSICCIASSENGLNASEISDRMQIDKAQVSRCMAELVDKGLVFHDEQEGKQYRQKYCLTQKGREVAADISRSSCMLYKQLCAGVEEKDMENFFCVLEMLCQNALSFSAQER